MTRVENDDVAGTLDGLSREEGMRSRGCGWARWGQDGCVVVLENKRRCVRLVRGSARACVAGAEIAFWVVRRQVQVLWWFGLSLPGSFRAVWRYEDVFPS